MFSNFVSLGGSCYTASSMSKYGLRSWSGPFDWLVSNDFEWILHYLENDFADFLLRENLDRWNGYAGKFRDKKSGFIFQHDEEYPFEEEYDKLRLKYQKRINKFLEEIKKPTCFLRFTADAHEMEYISNNSNYIKGVIKSKNEHNEIVFLVRDTIEYSETISFRHYILSIKHAGKNAPTREELRNAFDGSDAFLEYCASNYNSLELMRNIIFDHKKEERFRQDQARYHTLIKLLEFDFSQIQFPEEIIIYGAGNIGKYLYQKVKGKCRIRCFVDQEKDGVIDGIPIMKLEEIDADENINVVVTPTYDFANIFEKVKAHCSKAVVDSLDDILDMLEF